jgi:hypothetical protein
MYRIQYHGMEVMCDSSDEVRALAGNGVTVRPARKARATKGTKGTKVATATKARRRGMPPLPQPDMEEVKKYPYVEGPIEWADVEKAIRKMKLGPKANKTLVRRNLKLRKKMGKDI